MTPIFSAVRMSARIASQFKWVGEEERQANERPFPWAKLRFALGQFHQFDKRFGVTGGHGRDGGQPFRTLLKDSRKPIQHGFRSKRIDDDERAASSISIATPAVTLSNP